MIKLYIKISNNFDNGGTYIVYKWIHPSYSFLKLGVELWDLNTSGLFWNGMHLNFGHNLMLTITLANMKLHYHFSFKKLVFYFEIPN
jgi:hypothetical protein